MESLVEPTQVDFSRRSGKSKFAPRQNLALRTSKFGLSFDGYSSVDQAQCEAARLPQILPISKVMIACN